MNSIEAYKVLGLASGSSLDGVNASIITTDGIDIFSFGRTFEIPYDENMRESLRHMQKNFVTMNDDEKLRIENALTEFHIAAAREIMFDVEGINLIGFGGHVICHKPKEHILYQIGDGQKMADALQVKVVSKFRDADILAGGQGAPLAAIYHGALAQKMEKPIVFVDIGGISSLTWIGQNGEMIAFDAGPGNAAINWWVNKHGGMHMDYNGKLAICGKINDDVLNSMLKHKFFKIQPPKAADNTTFDDKLCEKVKGLVKKAYAVTPNFTEACLLTQTEYEKFSSNVTDEDFFESFYELAEKVQKLGPQKVVLTGVERDEGKHFVYNFILDGDKKNFTKNLMYGGHYSGTGDMLASVVAAGCASDIPLAKAVSVAADFIEVAVKDAFLNKIDKNDGVNFEKFLRFLAF